MVLGLRFVTRSSCKVARAVGLLRLRGSLLVRLDKDGVLGLIQDT